MGIDRKDRNFIFVKKKKSLFIYFIIKLKNFSYTFFKINYIIKYQKEFYQFLDKFLSLISDLLSYFQF